MNEKDTLRRMVDEREIEIVLLAGITRADQPKELRMWVDAINPQLSYYKVRFGPGLNESTSADYFEEALHVYAAF